VRADLKQWLSWLRQDVGFQGMRMDFCKGYAGRWVKVSQSAKLLTCC
jgi:alpha-amylase